jgi:putative Holliday junction resolvase
VPEPATPDRPAGTWLGFDFGLRRIGVAVGQTATRTARPLVVVRHGDRDPDWDHLRRLVEEWRPAGLVVGLPLGPEGDATPMSGRARAFGDRLAEKTGLPVAWCDERLSSRAAEQRFADRRASGTARRRDAALLDAMAAAIVLENWLQSVPDEP